MTVKPEIYSRSEHRLSRNDIDHDALKIMYRLVRYGHKGYLVGGGVRDILLGKKPKDFDIATDATPRRIKMLFRNSRIIGRRFKLAHIYFRGNKIIEVSTFRDSTEEIPPQESTGQIVTRDNCYGDEKTDALRRDLTVNALFYDLSTFSIIDYVGGMHDLENHTIRIVGDADVRFQEDPVRIIRAIRHAARHGFTIEPTTMDAIERNRDLLAKTSQMRLYDELKKDLISGYLGEYLKLLKSTGVLQCVIPSLAADLSLFKRGSLFLAAVDRADRALRQGAEISHTDIIALLTLFIRDTAFRKERLLDCFGDEEQVLDSLRDIFAGVPVPRRERERIASLIWQWRCVAAKEPRWYCEGVLKPSARLVSVRRLASLADDTITEEEEPPREGMRKKRSRGRNRRNTASPDRSWSKPQMRKRFI